MYGTMYGMKRTTLYLPDELKTAIEREAAVRGVSEAEFMRQALGEAVSRPERRYGIFSAEPFADRVDELLVGCGDS